MALTGPSTTDRIRRLLLAAPNRRRIFEAILHRPGIHIRLLARDLGLAPASVEHHVRQLTKHGVVFSHQQGRRRTLYAADAIGPEDAAVLHALRKPVWAELLALLCLGEECGVADIARRTGLPPTTASYHLRRMRDHGLLEHFRVGRQSIYIVCDPERVLRLQRAVSAPPDAAGTGAGLQGLVVRAFRHQGCPWLEPGAQEPSHATGEPAGDDPLPMVRR